MENLTFLVIVLFLVIVSFTNWRLGLFITLIAGFIQDPMRKILPGEPVYMVVFLGIFIAASFAGAKVNNISLNFRPMLGNNQSLNITILIFISLVFIQSLVTVITMNSIILAGIGLMAYLSPLVIVPIAYRFSNDMHYKIIAFIKFYIAVSILNTAGVYISFLGYDWKILEQVGVGLIAYSPMGEQLVLHCGFMRSPEVAAWHAGASACLVILLFVSQKKIKMHNWFSIFLTIYFITAIILTGRRKMLGEIILFITFFSFFLFYFRRGTSRLAIILLCCGILATLMGNQFLLENDFSSGILPYYQRGVSVGADAADRFHVMAFKALKWVIIKNGFFGSGAGIGSQGAQHFGGGPNIVGAAAEGGIGKVTAELGVPGTLLLFWMAYKLLQHLWFIMLQINHQNKNYTLLVYGMVSFLLSNAIVFVTAHQVFGDLFVLFIIGTIFGFTFSFQNKQTGITRKNNLTEIKIIS